MLRGINVGGHKKIKRLATCGAMYQARPGFSNVASYVQSGNVVFDSLESHSAVPTTTIETHIETTFGFPVSVFIRDADHFRRIIDQPIRRTRERQSGAAVCDFYGRSPRRLRMCW